MKTSLLFVIVIFGLIYPQTSFQKTNTNDHYNYISVNQIKMWVSNNGDGSHNPLISRAGFYWPGGENALKTAVYEDGLVWGGKINGAVYFNGNTHRQGLQAGKILKNGLPDDPSSVKYRVYKIREDWNDLPLAIRENYKIDYEQWPVEDGAPYYDFNNDGKYTEEIDQPFFEGDEVLWYVANDMDATRSTFTFGTLPIGLEFQTTIYAFKHSGVMRDVVIKKYKIINKSNNTIDSMYFGYWSDPDIGDARDDFIGCDTLLNLAYAYNGDNIDGDGESYTYGEAPPAVGYKLVQGPVIVGLVTDSAKVNGHWIRDKKNTPMRSFVWETSRTTQGVPYGAIEFYNYMKGYVWDGTQFTDPVTGLTTSFWLSGDPVAGTGWYEGPGWPDGPAPGNRRMLMGFGPITFSPGDTQEVVIAIIMAKGSDNIQSVAELKKKAAAIQKFYDLYTPELVNLKYESPKPEYYYLGQNYPNPFNPTTKINYSLPMSGEVTLKVFDNLGREMAVLVSTKQSPGDYEVEWNAGLAASGVYIYHLMVNDYSKTGKMLLLR